MKITRQLLWSVFTISIIVTVCNAREWRGIVPLHSTRLDVVRILGPSTDANEIRSVYHLEKEDVLIVFSGRQFCDSKSTRVAPGTVLMIQVTPRERLAVETLRVHEKNWREFRPSAEDINWRGFIDDQEGMLVRAFQETIDRVFYIPTATDRAACPSYYENPEDPARIVVDFSQRAFDRYSDLPFTDEKARLDNFAIYLGDKPDLRAYIVAHPGKNEQVKSRIERAKRYLIGLGVSEGRISLIIGGGRDKTEIELYALSPEAPSPDPEF